MNVFQKMLLTGREYGLKWIVLRQHIEGITETLLKGSSIKILMKDSDKNSFARSCGKLSVPQENIDDCYKQVHKWKGVVKGPEPEPFMMELLNYKVPWKDGDKVDMEKERQQVFEEYNVKQLKTGLETGISESHKDLIRTIRTHFYLYKAYILQKCDLGKNNKGIDYLISRGLVRQIRLGGKPGRDGYICFLSDNGYRVLGEEPPRLPGKMTIVHRNAQQVIAAIMQHKGYVVETEKQTDHGEHYIDVHAAKKENGIRHVCIFEVVVSENIDGQAKNLGMGLKLKPDKLVFVCLDKKTKDRLGKMIEKARLYTETKILVNYISDYYHAYRIAKLNG